MNQNKPEQEESQTMSRKGMFLIILLFLLIIALGYGIYSYFTEQINYAVNHMGSEPFD